MILVADWPRFFQQAFESTTPGGYIEIDDSVFPFGCDDGTMTPDSALAKWTTLLLEASKKFNHSLDSATTYQEALMKAGYVDVQIVANPWPLNSWARDRRFKEIGHWVNQNMLQGAEALTLALFTRALGWTPQEVEIFLVDIRRDLCDPRIHAFIPM